MRAEEARPRVTVCIGDDGGFEILLNDMGRQVLIEALQRLDRGSDHLHLDYYEDPDIANATDIKLANVPYNDGDRVLEHGKILFRPDDWDQAYFPHVMPSPVKGG